MTFQNEGETVVSGKIAGPLSEWVEWCVKNWEIVSVSDFIDSFKLKNSDVFFFPIKTSGLN